MWEPGTKVVCVNDVFPDGIRDYFNALPVKGRHYTVRDIVPGQDWALKGVVAIYLEELVNLPNPHGIEPGFHTDRFRELEPEEDKAGEVSEVIAGGEDWWEREDRGKLDFEEAPFRKLVKRTP